MAAVTMNRTPRTTVVGSGIVVPRTNLAICWNIRLESDATRSSKSSDNALGADNQQERQQCKQESRTYLRRSVITSRDLQTEKEASTFRLDHGSITRFHGRYP